MASFEDRFKGLRARIGARAKVLGRQARVVAELAAADRTTLKAWLENQGAVRAALGPQAADDYTQLVVKAARKEGRLGRIAALDIPDNLARVPSERRTEYVRLLGVVLRRRPQALGMVARTLPTLMEQLSGEALSRFIGSGVELHGDDVAVAESFLRGESRRSRQELERLALGLPLGEVRRTLALYARAHCGEDVQIIAIPPNQKRPAFSEGRNLHLPDRVDRYGDDRDFTVYRVLTARTAAYLEFGTFDLDLRRVEGPWPDRHDGESDLEVLLRTFPNRSLARDLFGVVEDARVEAHMVREYPGLKRDVATLRPDELAKRPAIDDLAPTEQLVEALLRRTWGQSIQPADDAVARALDLAWAQLEPELGVGDVQSTARLMLGLYPLADGLMRKVDPNDLPQNQEEAIEQMRQRLDPAESGGRGDPDSAQETGDYNGIEQGMLSTGVRPEELSADARDADEQARQVRDAMEDEGFEAALSEIRRAMQAEGRPDDDATYEAMMAVLERMPAPEGGLVEEGQDVEGEYQPSNEEPRRAGMPLDPDEDKDARTVLYPEWDVSIGDYKPDWVRVKEHVLQPGEGTFVQEVLDEHGAAIRHLRRKFQALRPEQLRRVKGLVDGDELDFDRVIEARVERKAGGSPTDRLYIKHMRNQRDVAVAFLLDMSSSTNEVAGEDARRIIRVEKEALVMIAEAVDAIGDACAIFGFSGYGRDHVAFYVAKDFKDAYGDRVRERIGRMTWKMENRDGAAIRHATKRLQAQPARTRLLILLSDGRPLDCGCDQYFDHYAQEDTRVALREARQAGVHPFCITVDPKGRRYLEQLYGEVGYIVIEEAGSLPARLPTIYRRLTR
jgi:nitric oxide reductase activation protein